MPWSQRELVAHVVRRLGIGAAPDLADEAADVDAAIAASFDLGQPAATAPTLPVPADLDVARDRRQLAAPLSWWFDQMASSRRRVEERLVWFLHDHFATSAAKAPAYLVWQQHLLIRRHALGRFDELLHAIATDPAMLFWLDGVSNHAARPNENFAREAMELFTVGNRHHDQEDVREAARACTGWSVATPGRQTQARSPEAPPWSPVFVPRRHDDGTKRILGRTGTFDLRGFIDVLVDHPATAERVAGKLHAELTGLPPDAGTRAHLGSVLRRRWHLVDVAEEIASHPDFLSDEAIRVRYRTPLERAITVVQSLPPASRKAKVEGVFAALRTTGYLPLFPPNVGGFPSGERLLGPHQILRSLEVLTAVAEPEERRPASAWFSAFGVADVSAASLGTVDAATEAGRQVALVLSSPELLLT